MVYVNVIVNGEDVPALRLSMDLSMAGSADISSENKLVGAIANLSVSFGLEWSIVPVLNVSALNPWLQGIIDDVILPLLNNELAVGWPLPMPPGLSLVNTNVDYSAGYISILAAVQADPSALRHHMKMRSMQQQKEEEMEKKPNSNSNFLTKILHQQRQQPQPNQEDEIPARKAEPVKSQNKRPVPALRPRH